MDFKLTEKEQAFRQECEEFFRQEMKNAPPIFNNEGGFSALLEYDEAWDFHKYMQKQLAKKNWLARPWPKEYGGENASLIEQLIFNEVRSHYRAPGIDPGGIGMFAPTLLVAASEEQKMKFLPPIARGEINYCQGWSEPDAGSDLASVKTTAIRDGDHYIVNGQKTWCSAAHRADRIFLLVRTDPESKRNAGLSVFDSRLDVPGVEIRPLLFMNRHHVYNDVFFNNVKIPVENRIGEEGEGWAVTRSTMNFERSGMQFFVEAKRNLEELIQYVKTTKRDGKYLSESPINRQKIAKLYSDIEVGRSLALKIVWLQQKGGLNFAASAASESKVLASEIKKRVGNFATEIMGLYGQLAECEWAPFDGAMEALYQISMGASIGGGTNEIQRNIIAWVGLKLPRVK